MNHETINEYLGNQGRVARHMNAFEFRRQQVTMAEAVTRSLADGHHLMVEAGTGTGKSLAYLIPAVLWAVKNNRKIVVSTYSKALQQQILHTDIPFLRDKLGLSFRYSLCVGHGNYLSLRRLKRAHQTGLFTDSESSRQLQAVADWAGTTETGVRGELPFEVLPAVWEDVGRQKELCLGKRCETYNACFYFKERKKWFGSHLLVVNHHLFFANIASGGGVLPRYDAVIFDEAQNVEEVATHFLGLELSNTALIYFLDRLFNRRTQKGILSRLETDSPILPLQKKVLDARRAVDTFFDRIFEEYGRQARVLRFYKPPPIENAITGPLRVLQESLKTFEGQLPSEDDQLEVSAAAIRCAEFNNTLNALLNQKVDDYVYWLELGKGRRFLRAILRGVPIDVSGPLKEQVFDRTPRAVLTSATLTTDHSFDFVKKRIGCEPKEDLILDSPFDFRTQALLYIPADLPEPSEKTGRYIQALSQRIKDLVEAAKGRTFVLFTSYDTLNRVHEELGPLSHKYPFLKQGEISTGRMIEKFKQTPSVIFGTNSFWQGIDIPGEALTSVIITKLPFDVPNEPLTEARLEHLRAQSVNPFKHYQLPRAIIQLKQGFGRLIRKKTDTGIVSILDPRLTNRGYGRRFIASLPDCRVVKEIAEVRKFLHDGIKPPKD
ncbi:MAG: ATP-dependent DNA helicase [Nitrospinales bacterium]